MAECIICEEDAGEGYDLCFECKNKSNVITIGNKNHFYYISKVIEKGQYHNRIIIKLLWNKMEEFNRMIKPILFYWGLEEIRRNKRKEKGKRDGREMEVYYITMEMIPPLKALKTDARRKGW